MFLPQKESFPSNWNKKRLIHENPKREKITIHEIDNKLRKLIQKQDQICVYLPKTSSNSRNPMKISKKNEEEKNKIWEKKSSKKSYVKWKSNKWF